MRKGKTEAEQQAFDQSSKFATRPGDEGWKQGVISSLENASMGAGSFERWERECIRVLWAWAHLDLDLRRDRLIRVAWARPLASRSTATSASCSSRAAMR